MLRQRMYHLVIYQLSGIQAGIQASHARDEYTVRHFDDPEFQQWINKDKVVIILNGGTTNNTVEHLGTINQHLHTLSDMGIEAEPFYEEDLGYQMTAIAFLVDERVWNEEKYGTVPFSIELFRRENPNTPDQIFHLRTFLNKFSLAKN